jgi:hypothetical protein
MNARVNAFDWGFTIRAAVRAGRQPDVGHFCLWFVDALARVCNDESFMPKDRRPRLVKRWNPVDTSIAPISCRGINFSLLNRKHTQGEPVSPSAQP